VLELTLKLTPIIVIVHVDDELNIYF